MVTSRIPSVTVRSSSAFFKPQAVASAEQIGVSNESETIRNARSNDALHARSTHATDLRHPSPSSAIDP